MYFTQTTVVIKLARIVAAMQLVFVLSVFISCNKNNTEIPSSLQVYLKNQGIQETIVDLNYSSSDFPDKKYMSLTVTYNFSTSDGKPQKEMLGFLLKMDGNEWKIDRNATYTRSEIKARELISGASK